MSRSSGYDIKLRIEKTRDEDNEALQNSTMLLVNELNQIDGIKDISFVTKKGKVPAGAKAIEIVSIGEIGISFITTGALAASLRFVSEWLSSRKRKIKIETKNGTVEGENLSKEDLEKIINLVKETPRS